MSKKKIGWRIVFLLFLIIATINIVLQQRNTPYQHDEGQVFGTYYHITYQNDTSLNDDIMAVVFSDHAGCARIAMPPAS